MKKKLHVYVLMGGPSPEHGVSLETGKMILRHLDAKKFNARPILITKTGRWLMSGGRGRAQYLSAPASARSGGSRRLLLGAVIPRFARTPSSTAPPQLLQGTAPVPADTVAFIAMHGPYGEDGTIQGLLELAGIPYTGSGVLASALAMDKATSAEVLRRHGLAVPRFICFTRTDWRRKKRALVKKIRRLGYPVVIKPRNLGSSVGITIVQKPDDLDAAVHRALTHAPDVMAQEYIRGRELTCGVIDEGIPGTEIALPPTEIIPKTSAFFDYRAKYTAGASEEITPPHLPTSAIKKIQRVALACHRALGCSGMSRTDMIIEENRRWKIENRKPKIYVLEVNTIPGMTETSLLPQAAKASGISFPQLLERIIRAALNRHKKKIFNF